MEKLIIPEQNIINAVCVYISRQLQCEPEDVEVELLYDDENGFTAEAYLNEQKEVLNTFNLIKALRLSMEEFLNIDPISTGIELLLDDEEGIVAAVN
ncbi:DUF2653 family protein [Psychrobacillus glaciei]|uniref:DUF2653 family protein n=1 Tax=Psychrobacillus glaciei TaxID=2283160 RepID=A0A5J6SNA1_9BACI|nr:DUF2653 family protein [Psychrobacillus glaciei]QFF97687.1 DUF2653 family protein [Psychrobacillus glaciei]